MCVCRREHWQHNKLGIIEKAVRGVSEEGLTVVSKEGRGNWGSEPESRSGQRSISDIAIGLASHTLPHATEQLQNQLSLNLRPPLFLCFFNAVCGDWKGDLEEPEGSIINTACVS